jgi:hypothetical protein
MKKRHSKPKTAAKRRRGLEPSRTPQEEFDRTLKRLGAWADYIYTNVRQYNLKQGLSAVRYGFIANGRTVRDCTERLFAYYVEKGEAELGAKQVRKVEFDVWQDKTECLYALAPKGQASGKIAGTEKPGTADSASLRGAIAEEPGTTSYETALDATLAPIGSIAEGTGAADATWTVQAKDKVEEANASLAGTGFAWWRPADQGLQESAGFTVGFQKHSIRLWYEATENSPDADIYPDGEDVAVANYDSEHRLWVGLTDAFGRGKVGGEPEGGLPQGTSAFVPTAVTIFECYGLSNTSEIFLHRDIGALLEKMSAWAIESKPNRVLHRIRMAAARETMYERMGLDAYGWPLVDVGIDMDAGTDDGRQ